MCPECYSKYSRITPLIKPENCLKNHRQYICSTCGRCICADKSGKRYRARFPFKTLEIAKLYLRSAEVIEGKCCGIYEIVDNKGRKFYKIFSDQYELEKYLINNTNKKSTNKNPLYETNVFNPFAEDQLRKLTKNEIDIYLKERKEQCAEWNEI